MAYVHGANAPRILRTLTEQLAQEHKVLDGSAERKEVCEEDVCSLTFCLSVGFFSLSFLELDDTPSECRSHSVFCLFVF